MDTSHLDIHQGADTVEGAEPVEGADPAEGISTFDYPQSGEIEGCRCYYCQNDIKGDGYKIKINNLATLKSQCPKCRKYIWNFHSKVTYDHCIMSIKTEAAEEALWAPLTDDLLE